MDILSEPAVILSIGAGAGLAAAVFGPLISQALHGLVSLIQSLVWWFFSLVIVQRKFFYDKGLSDVLQFLMEKGKIAKSTALYDTVSVYVKPLKAKRRIWGRFLNLGWAMFLYRGAPVLYICESGGEFYALRGTINFDRLLAEVEEWSNRKQSSSSRKFKIVRFSHGRVDSKTTDNDDNQNGVVLKRSHEVFEPLHWREEELGIDMEGGRLQDLSLSKELQGVVKDVRFWHEHRDWYNDRGISWRRGYLFYGQPGTGKTSLARALAENLDLPVHVFDLSSMSNSDLVWSWGVSAESGARIVLLEDIDSVFHGRENVAKADRGLTFDALLNTIDGIEREDGLLLIVTTNHLEHVDPALGIPDGKGGSTRPGRIDRTVEFLPLDEAGRVKLAMRIVKDEAAAAKLASEASGDTASQFQERCMQYALRMLWDSKDSL